MNFTAHQHEEAIFRQKCYNSIRYLMKNITKNQVTRDESHKYLYYFESTNSHHFHSAAVLILGKKTTCIVK